MFESDDFDQVLSQFELPGESNVLTNTNRNICNEKIATQLNPIIRDHEIRSEVPILQKIQNVDNNYTSELNYDASHIKMCNTSNVKQILTPPKHSKRKMINLLFDCKNKRKFPGPAGILNENLQEDNDENINHMEILSQDIDLSQNPLHRDIFRSPLWIRLSNDVKEKRYGNVDTIQAIKKQALAGNLRRRKAQTVTALVEYVDRSVSDPLIKLTDVTGSIKCTLHRDAWLTFSKYILSEYCALVLWKPTVLTTGGAFKKHYLNITLNNICAIYVSTVVHDDENDAKLVEGFVKSCEDDLTIIRNEIGFTELLDSSNTSIVGANDMDDLDNMFSEDLF